MGSRATRPIRAGHALVLASLVWVACAVGPASAAVVPTLVGVTQEGGIAADCVAPLPSGAGAASALYTFSGDGSTIRTDWSIPAQITAGSQVTLQLQMNTFQGFSGLILLNAPPEFGGQTPPFEVAGSVPPGGGSFSGSKAITFTPTRAFTAGERLFLRLGNGCNAFIYEYVGTGTPDPPATPTRPAIVPPTTRPVPGVVTSYAAPRPGTPLKLPFPQGGCGTSVSLQQAAPAPAGGECSVDIFLVRKNGKEIDDPAAEYGVDLRVSDANLERAQKVCVVFLTDTLSSADDDAADDALGRYAQCAVVVARILQRAEDLRRRREGTSLQRASQTARRCRAAVVRLKGARRAASPARVTCARVGKGVRVTVRSARAGRSVGSVVLPTSKLILSRSTTTAARPGDRFNVRWTVTAPRLATP